MTPQKKPTTVLKELAIATTEEEVKAIVAQFMGLKYDTKDNIDLYTEQSLFEFKADRNLQSPRLLASTLAQALYYVRRLKYEEDPKAIPPYICLISKSHGVLTATYNWHSYVTNHSFNWLLKPSDPDARLVEELANDPELRQVHVYALNQENDGTTFLNELRRVLQSDNADVERERKVITEQNFEAVYGYWAELFGEKVRNGLKPSKYFVSDIQDGKTTLLEDSNQVIFYFANGEARPKRIFTKEYKHFWSLYDRIRDPQTLKGVLAKVDRLTEEFQRRFNGEFFTPIKYAKRALSYIEQATEREWWKNPNYRLWDMAAGTGNLEYHLPAEAQDKCYLSTLYQEDVEHCKLLFPHAHVFQYDYLNDDVNRLFDDPNRKLYAREQWKMPQQLRNDLNNPDIKWIILINPPFATAQTAGTSKKASKTDVSMTYIREHMHDEGMGETSRELFSQFLYRISKEFKGKSALLAMFSKVKYINSNNDYTLRNNFFKYRYVSGFIFHSKAFHGVRGDFPIGCLLWDLNYEVELSAQSITVDIIDDQVQSIGVKSFTAKDKAGHLSKWIKRPKADLIFPPFASGINIAVSNKDTRDRIARGFLASLMAKGNDFQNQNYTALLSGPYVSAGALSVVPENFESAMVVHTVRRLPRATWLNDRDQFLAPNAKLDPDFINDCVVWSLWSNANQTASLGEVDYKGNRYQVDNRLFPFPVSALQRLIFTDAQVKASLSSTKQVNFMPQWIASRRLTPEAQAVMGAGFNLYKFFYANLNKVDVAKYHIQSFDAGFYQVVQSLKAENLGEQELKALKATHDALGESLLPRIVAYGFIDEILG